MAAADSPAQWLAGLLDDHTWMEKFNFNLVTAWPGPWAAEHLARALGCWAADSDQQALNCHSFCDLNLKLELKLKLILLPPMKLPTASGHPQLLYLIRLYKTRNPGDQFPSTGSTQNSVTAVIAWAIFLCVSSGYIPLWAAPAPRDAAQRYNQFSLAVVGTPM